MAKFLKFNKPKERTTGYNREPCKLCGRVGPGHIKKYGLYICRQCFRENAQKVGFKKYR